MPVPVFRPFIKRKDMDAVLTSLVSDSVNTGAETEAFVNELLEIIDFEAGIGFREFPRGIQTAIRALDLPLESRIGISVLAPVMYEQAIRETGNVPVLIDCYTNNPCIDPNKLQELHAQQPLQAVVIHTLLGFFPEMTAISALHVPVVIDATESFTGINNELIQSADILLIGLEANGILTAAGGVLVFGKSKAMGNLLGKVIERYPREVFLQDMNAALGRAQLRQLEYFMQRRSEISEILTRSAMRGRHHLLAQVGENPGVPYSFPLLIQSSVTDVQTFARKKNIEVIMAFAYSIIHNSEGREDFEPRAFPNAYGFLLRCVLFPLYPGMSLKELELIEKVIASLP